MRFQVGIAGHSGYSGTEALKLLTRHPHIDPLLLHHRETADGGNGIAFTPAAVQAAVQEAKLDAILLATSPDVSMAAVPWILDTGARCIDLSGAFRLGTADNFSRWYNEPHTASHLLQQAVYGLPEFNRAAIAGAQFVSNPGCYPTAANLALAPLVSAGLIDRSAGVICDAKSGVSGAGRKASLKTSFCEVSNNFSVYSVLRHRHVPEVLQTSGLQEHEFSFTAQLIPIDRGILETIYFRATPANLERIESTYRERYAAEPFVRLEAPGTLPDILSVAHTNLCGIGWVTDPASCRGVIVTAIDNLGKGAAGQAIQNLNLMLGLPETEGLL